MLTRCPQPPERGPCMLRDVACCRALHTSKKCMSQHANYTMRSLTLSPNLSSQLSTSQQIVSLGPAHVSTPGARNAGQGRDKGAGGPVLGDAPNTACGAASLGATLYASPRAPLAAAAPRRHARAACIQNPQTAAPPAPCTAQTKAPVAGHVHVTQGPTLRCPALSSTVHHCALFGVRCFQTPGHPQVESPASSRRCTRCVRCACLSRP